MSDLQINHITTSFLKPWWLPYFLSKRLKFAYKIEMMHGDEPVVFSLNESTATPISKSEDPGSQYEMEL